jgi:hypothetical protein
MRYFELKIGENTVRFRYEMVHSDTGHNHTPISQTIHGTKTFSGSNSYGKWFYYDAMEDWPIAQSIADLLNSMSDDGFAGLTPLEFVKATLGYC